MKLRLYSTSSSSIRKYLFLLFLLVIGFVSSTNAYADCHSGYTTDPFVPAVCYDCPSGWDRNLLQPDPSGSNACTRNRGVITKPASTSSASCTTVLGVRVCTCPIGQGRVSTTCYRCDSPYAKNILRSWTDSNACEWNPPREYTSASLAVNTCGGEGDRACTITERIPSCDTNLVEVAGRCEHPDCGYLNDNACTVVQRIPSCDQGLVELLNTSGAFCRRIESDGFPNHCGRDGQPPCQITENIPSCKGDAFEWAGLCQDPEPDGYPDFCGDADEPACNVLLQSQLLILACKPGNYNEGGTCKSLDGIGYPESCGDPNEPACTVDQQLLFGIDACKTNAYNDFGTCKALDEDGYPVVCGGISEEPCLLDEQIRLGITSCKPTLEENIAPIGLCVDDCGGHGLPACAIGGCDSGLTEQENDTIDGDTVCGASPVNYGESDADELVPRGPRVVFFIHGRGGDLGDERESKILRQLAFKTSNIVELYGVDWNNRVRETSDISGRRVLIKKMVGDYDNPQWQTVKGYGRKTFNNRTHTIFDTAQAISEGIRDIDPDQAITILTHSYGGVIARQLIYRHYDQMRAAGHTIAEVLTVKGPHTGGLVGTPDFIGEVGLFTETGLDSLTTFGCTVGRLGDLAGIGAGQDGCQLGSWVKWSLDNAPISIDDEGYPQIRWITVAGNGYRLGSGAIDSALESGFVVDPFLLDIFNDTKNVYYIPFQDTDETVSTRSAFGIKVDACFPYTADSPPGSSSTDATIVYDRKLWDTGNGVQPSDSATCYHANGTLPGANVRPQSGHGFATEINEQIFVFNAIATALPSEDTDGDNLLDVQHDNCDGVNSQDITDTDGDNIGDVCDLDDDNDGLLDTFEEAYGYDPLVAGEESSDDDGDTLTALEEQSAGTRPDKADTDEDGFNDDIELAAGSDPNDLNSIPATIVELPLWFYFVMTLMVLCIAFRIETTSKPY